MKQMWIDSTSHVAILLHLSQEIIHSWAPSARAKSDRGAQPPSCRDMVQASFNSYVWDMDDMPMFHDNCNTL